MVDQSAIQVHINHGYGIAATKLGNTYLVYRPTVPAMTEPPIGSLMADFDVNPGFTYAKPGKYAEFGFYLLADATDLLVGDIFVSTNPTADTYFMAGQEPNKPPLCVYANRRVTITRPTPTPPGPGYYGGSITGEVTTILTGWPASLLSSGRSEKGSTALPQDEHLPRMTMLIPPFGNVALLSDDVIMDDLGVTYTMQSAELTRLGWRIFAEQTTT